MLNVGKERDHGQARRCKDQIYHKTGPMTFELANHPTGCGPKVD